MAAGLTGFSPAAALQALGLGQGPAGMSTLPVFGAAKLPGSPSQAGVGQASAQGPTVTPFQPQQGLIGGGTNNVPGMPGDRMIKSTPQIGYYAPQWSNWNGPVTGAAGGAVSSGGGQGTQTPVTNTPSLGKGTAPPIMSGALAPDTSTPVTFPGVSGKPITVGGGGTNTGAWSPNIGGGGTGAGTGADSTHPSVGGGAITVGDGSAAKDANDHTPNTTPNAAGIMPGMPGSTEGTWTKFGTMPRPANIPEKVNWGGGEFWLPAAEFGSKPDGVPFKSQAEADAWIREGLAYVPDPRWKKPVGERNIISGTYPAEKDPNNGYTPK